MQTHIDFTIKGNSDCFIRNGWSEQEELFRWSLGEASSIAIPYLFAERGMDVEVSIAGSFMTGYVPLRFKVDQHVLSDTQISGPTTIRFRIPPRPKLSQQHLMEIEHPEFKVNRNETSAGHHDRRALAICFRSIRFSYIGEHDQITSFRTLIVGSSHISALQFAYNEYVPDSNSADASHFIALPPSNSWARPPFPRFRYDPRLVEEITQIYSGKVTGALVSTIYGNGHFIFGSVRHSNPFDFHSIENDPLEQDIDRTLIPYSLVYKSAKNSSYTLLGLLGVLGQRLGLPTYHVSSPPPSPDEQKLALTVQEISKRHPMQSGSVNKQIESATFRLKCWRLYERAAREVVEADGGVYLAPPAECIDSEGFLRREMAGDGLHANVRYGHAVLNQISSVLNEIRP